MESRLALTLMMMTMTTTLTVVEGYSGKVLLVSMDGFRHDYVSKISGLTNFARLAEMGVHVKDVLNPFTTCTIPSHYTMATGLWEESHGIVGNSMYDPVLNKTFKKGSTETYWWDGGEPIWITAEKKKRHSTGVYFWAGSEAEVQGLRPSIYKPYDLSTPFAERVQTALGWFPDKDLVLLYFHEPDSTGHKFGPESPEVADKVREMDGVLGQILDAMEQKGLKDTVNLILMSDHGMTEIDCATRLLDLDDYVNKSMVDRVPYEGPVTAILPREGHEAEVLAQARKIPHATTYSKEEIPDKFHYKNHRRVMPIIVLCDEGWYLSAEFNKTRDINRRGDHGYSNELSSMRPMMYMAGPDFRQGLEHAPTVYSVDIYPLICHLMGLDPAPNNGSLQRTEALLRPQSLETQTPATQALATQPTESPATQAPVTLSTTQSSATQAPTTQPTTTQSPTTQPPATQPPVTQPPATLSHATESPATQPPVTQPPATQPSVTQPPSTQPCTDRPPGGYVPGKDAPEGYAPWRDYPKKAVKSLTWRRWGCCVFTFLSHVFALAVLFLVTNYIFRNFLV